MGSRPTDGLRDLALREPVQSRAPDTQVASIGGDQPDRDHLRGLSGSYHKTDDDREVCQLLRVAFEPTLSAHDATRKDEREALLRR